MSHPNKCFCGEEMMKTPSGWVCPVWGHGRLHLDDPSGAVQGEPGEQRKRSPDEVSVAIKEASRQQKDIGNRIAKLRSHLKESGLLDSHPLLGKSVAKLTRAHLGIANDTQAALKESRRQGQDLFAAEDVA